MKTVRLASEIDFAGWRAAARRLAIDGVPPEEIDWVVGAQESLFAGAAQARNDEPEAQPLLSVCAAFIRLAKALILHRDPQRFAVLYRLLWRLREEPRLLMVATDEDVTRARNMKKAIDRDIHKMHAYVRFRESQSTEGTTYIAWFEPSHYIVEAAAPFFVRRFAAMRWSILTPDASAYWDGEQLHVGPGAERADAPGSDALEALWLGYYKSIFNPARLKVGTMQGHMPKKYWANLPEAALIPSLISEAAARTAAMIDADARTPRRRGTKYAPPETVTPVDVGSLDALRFAAAGCRACPLWQHATQTVFGEGPGNAQVMFVGEQPGDQEDLAGRPFVGPAGQLFDRMLAAAGVDRDAVYVTNAVKHFKFEPRGKRRIHKTPAQQEIAACNRWLEEEILYVKPKLIVAMGGTALRALVGSNPGVQSMRGRIRPLRAGTNLLITVHPSYLLRVPRDDQPAAFERFVADLSLVPAAVARSVQASSTS